MTLRVMTQDRTAHLSRSLQHHGVTIHINGQQWSYLNDSDGLWLTADETAVMVVEYTDSYTFTVLDSMDYDVQAYTVLMLHVAIDRAGRRDATLRINREDMCVLIAMSNDMQNMVQRIRAFPVTPISLINI